MNSPVRDRLRRFWREDGVFVSLMLVLFLLRIVPAFAQGQLYAPFRDNVWIYGPMFSRASEIALTGQFPYWLDTILGGFPLYQTPHFSVTYPFYFFGWLNYGKELESLYTLSYLTAFHVLILYLNLYVMLRTAGVKGLASLCAATIGLISGNTEVYTHWITITASYSWFPLLIAAMIRLLRAPLSFWSIVLFSLAAALICTASPSQTVIHAALVGGVFFIAGGIRLYFEDGRAAVIRLLLGLILTGIIAFALSGVAFLPMTIATGGMIRHVGLHPPVLGHAAVPWESFNDSQLVPQNLIHLLFDSSDLHVVGGLYVGPLAVLGISMVFLAYRQGDPFTRFLLTTFGVMAAYFLIAGFGTHSGLAYLHFHIPLLNRIREAGRYLVLFTTFVVFLAGFGLQAIVNIVAEGCVPSKQRRYVYISLLLSFAALVLAFIFDFPKVTNSWLVLAVCPIAFILIPAASVRQRLTSAGFVLLACFASVLSRPATQPFFVSQYLDVNNLKSYRVLSKLAHVADIDKYRVAILDKTFTAPFWGNNASYYGIRTFYALVTPQPYNQFLEMFKDGLAYVRELRGAKYFICGQNAKPLNPKARLVFAESGYRVFEVPDAMGPYTLVHQAQTFDSEKSFSDALGKGFDYQHIAAIPTSLDTAKNPLLAEVKAQAQTGAPPAVGYFVQPILNTSNLFGVVANSTKPAILVFNERWSKDWHARINSRSVKVERVNFTQVGVVIPPGRNYVEFEYKPMLFWYLLLLQRTTFALLFVVGCWKLFARWRSVRIAS